MNNHEHEWITRVRKLPCGCCGAAAPSQAHHLRTDQGGAQRAGHYCAIPLCPECHTGRHGFHGDRLRFTQARVTELSILNDTIAVVARMMAAARMM